MTTEIEYAQLSLYVCLTKNSLNKPLLPEGWELASPDSIYPDNLGGFSYGVFRRTGTSEIVLAYTGSNENLVVDYLGTNIPAGLGLPSVQVFNAALAYEKVLHTYGTDAVGSNITFSGHSLGGGLASVMAVWFDRPAVVFDEAPFQPTAQNTTLIDLTRTFLLFNGYHNDALNSASLHFSNREQQVKNHYMVGEILASLRTDATNVAGSSTPVSANVADISTSLGDRVNLHSQALLTAMLLSNSFRVETFSSTRVLPLLMDKNFYAYDAATSDQQNVLINFIRSEQGSGDKLSHFAADLNKLGTNISGLNKAAQDAIIAQGIEWYYWQDKDYAGKEFFTQTGESLQYTTALGAGLAGAQNKAANYAGKWLTPIVNDHGEFYSVRFARDYDQWNIATGTAGVSLTALKSDKSQIFIDPGKGDTFTGGDLNDVMFAGAGNDRYVIESSDGIGNNRNKAGQRNDGSYVFLSNPTITVAGGADLTLTLADGSGVTHSKTKKHCHISCPSRGRGGGRSICKREGVSAFTGIFP